MTWLRRLAAVFNLNKTYCGETPQPHENGSRSRTANDIDNLFPGRKAGSSINFIPRAVKHQRRSGGGHAKLIRDFFASILPEVNSNDGRLFGQLFLDPIHDGRRSHSLASRVFEKSHDYRLSLGHKLVHASTVENGCPVMQLSLIHI